MSEAPALCNKSCPFIYFAEKGKIVFNTYAVGVNFLIIDFLFDIVGEIIGHFIPEWLPKTKFEKHISRLMEEDWFSSIEKDYRYAYIIYENRRVKRFLSDEKNIKMIISMDEEREKFISLVKEEHVRFTRVH